MHRFLFKAISSLLILIGVYSVNQWSSFVFGTTFFWWFIFTLLTICIVKLKGKYNFNLITYQVVNLYLIWAVICIIRGCFVAENYWEWKNLISTIFVLILPVYVYVFSYPHLITAILKKWFKYALPLFFILMFILESEAYGRYLVPISFLALFYPSLKSKWKIIIICFTVFIVLVDISARSNVIKAIVPLIFSITYYFRKKLVFIFFKFIYLTLIGAPFIFFLFALFGGFNIFKMNEYIEGKYESKTITKEGYVQRESLISDSRTLLYIEVLNSALNNDYILAGRTPARGNDSILFGYLIQDETQTGKYERHSNEVAVLNIFTWTGLLGLFFYFLIFLKSSYLSIYKSKNIYVKIIGLYIAFRWCYAWVEDFSRYNLSNIFLMVCIGIGLSSYFREMSNDEFRHNFNIFLKNN